jgi:hypothetical protein
MFTIQQPSAKAGRFAPAIKCLPLEAFEANSLKSVREVFRPMTRHALGQAWLEREENNFAPAFVRFGWRENALLVFAEIIDFDIFNAATILNQRAWELGDTFEIFLQSINHPGYFEFQVTPQNQRVQLRFTDSRIGKNVGRTGLLPSVYMPGEAFYSRTWIQLNARCWYVYAEICAKNLFGHPGSLEGNMWRFSFSRYDYTCGRKLPVISSTSRHAEPDFHRRHEWKVMSFESSTPQSSR